MYVVTDTRYGTNENVRWLNNAIALSLIYNSDDYETSRGAIVTALHWIEQVDEK